MAKVQIEFEIKGYTADEIVGLDNGRGFFCEACDEEEKDIPDMIAIEETHFQRDGVDDNFFIFKFIKAYD
jgi:hypothetical protein